MTRRPRHATRPAPVFRASDGVPWPTDDELDLDAEWAAFRESSDVEWWAADVVSDPRDRPDDDRIESRDGIATASAPLDLAGWSDGSPDGWSDPGPDGEPDDLRRGRSGDSHGERAVSDLDARLGHLQLVVAERHRATAEEYRLIAAILADASADPSPWVGPDPTLDRAWIDRRGRTVAAVRRDRVDMAQRAAVAEIALRLRVSEQTVRARATRCETLQERCPRMWRAFADGRTSERHAVEAARLADSLPATAIDAALPSDGDDAGHAADTGAADAREVGASDGGAGTTDGEAGASDGGADIDAATAVWRAFDTAVTDRAVRLVPAKFAVAARAIREKVHAESVDVRHRRAAADRGVWMAPELDGMASLTALLPAADARGVMTQLDRAARHLQTARDEERTLAQLRADVLADLIVRPVSAADAEPRSAVARRVQHSPTGDTPQEQKTDDAHSHPPASPPPREDSRSIASQPPLHVDGSSPPHALGPHTLDPRARPLDPRANAPGRRSLTPSPVQATVILTVPALTLLGASREPATLDGYGPIDLDTARRLAGGATSWIRLLTDPVTAVPLALERKTYRVPVALRRWLGITSPTCAFPGCARAANDCDIDHRRAWADGGGTDADNLDPECRHHHRIRHDTRWSPSTTATGGTTWTSPLGAGYDADPPPF